MENTFVMIKPDGVKRDLIGEIIGRFERKGLKIVGMKMLWPDQKLAEAHYSIHKGKSFYENLIKYIKSGPVIAMVWRGENAVAQARQLIGGTDPLEAYPGSIRGDFSIKMQRNLIHGSDASETAEKEINLWFPEGIIDHDMPLTPWI
jgi:nucleoside-diphosphate kinase